ncbi:DUF1365 domain-containing protein [Kitasatospora sp. NPDC049258]|uniref:DUF1365 domain-containing protein n=1 Tax=Kitasatospora sp. NPDC049258 TaxID=3155394 RepID=UPI0034207837
MTPAPLPGPWGAALYESTVTHVRSAPLRHRFRHRTFLWLVDLDRLPHLPLALRPLARFRSADHPGDPRLTLRQNLDRYLAGEGVDLAGGRVLMLTQARSLGHVFNPLTVYWCHTPDGRPACTVAEVHNTYGGAHRYLLRPDPRGRAVVAKEFYVSPFFPVDGSYRMSLPEPGERLALVVQLERAGGRPFTAAVRGTRRAAGPAALLRAALRHPFATWAVPLDIRRQGIRLLLRGLPVQPRPRTCPQTRQPVPQQLRTQPQPQQPEPRAEEEVPHP